MKVRFAVSVGATPPEANELAALVAGIEERGLDTLWLADVPSLPSSEPQLAVAYAAALTRRVKLGVNLIPFGTTPYLLAHRIAQLDRLTGGRLLVTLVPGLDLPGERAALGTTGRHRGRMMDEMLPLLRRLWAGEAVEIAGARTALPVRPLQEPLEVWLGGSGPEAVARAGRLSDGWLGSRVTPARAGRLRGQIQAEAARAGREISPEHFGLSIAYARRPEDLERAGRPAPAGPDLSDLVPVGADALRRLVGQLVSEGLSKFVLRPVAPPTRYEGPSGWAEELDWLGGAVMDLQT